MTKTIRTLMMLATVICMASAAQLAQAASATAGQAVYKAKCQMCHGADGSGNLPKAKVNPLGGATVQAMSDTDLKKSVTAGTGTMKPVAGVAGADLDNVVAFVRSLKK
jgi:mono/diheme cytochrome c family protein